MASNFLGDPERSTQSSPIISANEVLAREGVNLQRGMNFRDDGLTLSVFLSLPRDGVFHDAWDEEKQLYIYEGHDSITVEDGKAVDQLMMYGSGKVTDNGKFFKAANLFKDGVRKGPLQIQVYEKLDPGVWFDKGIFNLIDAQRVDEGGRKVFKFHLTPADAGLDPGEWDEHRAERLLPAAQKVAAWQAGGGRCAQCTAESGLHFDVESGEPLRLLCARHYSASVSGLIE